MSEEVKGHIREYEKLNIKPAAILIALREKIDDLPTKMQVNNYLKTLRNKKELDGRLGNLSCLEDFLELFAANKEIPEDPDQMFVADCWTEIKLLNSDIVKKFRIFFTTKRLLSFTKYVSHPSLYLLLFIFIILIYCSYIE